MWSAPATEVAASHHRITAAHPGRFLLGVGIGHPEATQEYRSPYDTIVDYLDVLDAEGVPVEDRVLAALGPKVLALAAERTAGAHPYLTTPEHTRLAREILGEGPLLAPEQKVVLDTDPVAARALGRPAVDRPYLHLRNYTSNLRRLGWTDADLADGGSDALIDALVVHGDAATVAAGVRAHLDAGADHVCLQLLTPPGADPCPACARSPPPRLDPARAAGPRERGGRAADSAPGVGRVGLRGGRPAVMAPLDRHPVAHRGRGRPPDQQVRHHAGHGQQPGGDEHRRPEPRVERGRVGVVRAADPGQPGHHRDRAAARPPARRRCSPRTPRRRTGPGPTASTVAVSGATVSASPAPKTSDAGQHVRRPSSRPARCGAAGAAPAALSSGPTVIGSRGPIRSRECPGPRREHEHDRRDRQQRRAGGGRAEPGDHLQLQHQQQEDARRAPRRRAASPRSPR